MRNLFNLFATHLRVVIIIASAIIILGVAGIGTVMLRQSQPSAEPTYTGVTTENPRGSDGSMGPSSNSAPDSSAKDSDKTPSTAKNNSGKTTPGGNSNKGSSSGNTTNNSSSGGGSGSSGGGSGGDSGSSPPLVCPGIPAFPDENCTGYAHTGVTLHACSLPLVEATYDSCLFTGEVNVSADDVTVTRSKIEGYVSYRTVDQGSLRGLTLIDVEIDSTDYQGGSTIGNNDYTCIRCNVHGGTRGFNVGYNVTIRDSYTHGWNSQDGDHITGIGSNGGAHNVIDHNNVSCDILNDATGYACSSGLSVYGDDPPGNDDWVITNNLINSASSYCMIIAGPPSKTYPFTNMVVTGNHFGYLGARIHNLPDSSCSEFGPINQPGGGVHDWNSGTTNIWSGNVDSNGNTVAAPS